MTPSDRAVKSKEGCIFTPEEMLANERVLLFLAALGKRAGMIPLYGEEVHRYFFIFAGRVGWTGPLYELSDALTCPAVLLSLKGEEAEEEDVSKWQAFPAKVYDEYKERLQAQPEFEMLLNVADQIRKLWLPDLKF